MTRADIPPPLRGKTFLVAEHGAAEQPGRLWHPKGQLPDDDRWPRWVAYPIAALTAAALWGVIISAALGVLR